MAVSPRIALRALLLALLIAAVLAPLTRAEDVTAPTGTVSLAPSDGGVPVTLDLAALAGRQDVVNVRYALRAADGTTSETTVASGFSLDALLAAARLDGDEFTYAEITRPDGGSALMVREVAGEGPPVVWADAQGVHFLRPSAGDGDPNGADLVTLPPGSTLSVLLHEGDPIAARISASALRAKPGDAIDFSATLVAGTLGPGMEYSWYFDDQRYATGANVTHRFRAGGRYTVLLNIVRGGGAVGTPAVVVVQIDRPAREREGARRSGERDDGARAGGGTGTGEGAGGGGSGGGTGNGSGSGLPSPAASQPVAAAPAPAPVEPPPAPRARPRRAPAPQPQGELVSGTLLASTGGAPPAAGGAPDVAARDADDPLDIPIGVWVAIGVLAVVALGWTLESRHTLPFWQP